MDKKKTIIVITAGVLVAIIVALVLFLTVFRKDAYRILKVYEYSGKASVTRQDIGNIEPYNNMVLESGDTVALDEGKLVLLADEDKYIHLEEGTELVLNATGSSDTSKTTIELKSGAITNDIQNKLSEGSSYEVNTPNSTMSVRGTIFRVEVYEENGIKYTRVSVFEGKVASRLIYKNGDVADNEVTIEKGKEVLIYEDDNTVDYVSPPRDIDYSDLPESVIELLDKALSDGRDLDIARDELEKYLNSIVTVTFVYDGKVFGTQTIERGGKAVEPTLTPAASGSWDWDFSKKVNKDTTIEWK
ncbi:FecR family protein [Lachnospiraceae bacterium NE2001]|nr:FecR family protein [Lachnospiraceae bacterium NE2001]